MLSRSSNDGAPIVPADCHWLMTTVTEVIADPAGIWGNGPKAKVSRAGDVAPPDWVPLAVTVPAPAAVAVTTWVTTSVTAPAPAALAVAI